MYTIEGVKKVKRKKKELAMFICVCLLSSLMMPIVAVASDPEADPGYDPYSILVVIRQDLQGGSTPEDLNSAADYFNSFLSVPNAIIETETLMDYSEPNPDTEDPTDGDNAVPKAIVKLCLSEEGSQKLDQLLDELVTNPFVESAGKNYTIFVPPYIPSEELYFGENYTFSGAYLYLADIADTGISWDIKTLSDAISPFGWQLVDANGNPFQDDTLPVPTGAQIFIPSDYSWMFFQPSVVVLGDGTGDGRVNTADARFALRMAVGLEEIASDVMFFPSIYALDTDLSGTVTTSDARTLLRYTVGLSENLMSDWNDAYAEMVRRMIFQNGVE